MYQLILTKIEHNQQIKIKFNTLGNKTFATFEKIKRTNYLHMRRTLLLLAICLNFIGFDMQSQTVSIPDANFKNALLADPGINTNSDTEIQTSEAAAVVNLDINTLSISDLTGIAAFTSLSSLQCYSNSITTLNLSANTALTVLDCGSNLLTSLNVSTNTALTYLDCTFNTISGLDVSSNTDLVTLLCNDNVLTTLNVSANPVLTTLHCSYNQLTAFDISADTLLINLECNYNLLDTLDVRTNIHLTDLLCTDNQLTALDVSKNTSLTLLDCTNNTAIALVCVNPTQLGLTSSNAASWLKPGTASWSTTNCADTFVGIEELTDNVQPKTLIHIYNVLGQEIDISATTRGVLFIYQYSDGSVEKIIRL